MRVYRSLPDYYRTSFKDRISRDEPGPLEDLMSLHDFQQFSYGANVVCDGEK
jgi:hypothetical protein